VLEPQVARQLLASDSWRTWATVVTVARTVTAVPLGALALVERSAPLLVAAYAIYWLGDILDGWLARRLQQETRVGAVLDIISDRASTGILVAALLMLQPDLWLALAVFLLQFLVVDCVVSLSFLCWGLVSPNDFHLVDARVWQLNWSPAAKVTNSAAVILAVAAGWPLLAITIAAVQLAVKCWTAYRIKELLVQPSRSDR
jgi:CDP-diacylglycerol--glycerol-3-phosphate 3-phosphatidyltransferase